MRLLKEFFPDLSDWYMNSTGTDISTPTIPVSKTTKESSRTANNASVEKKPTVPDCIWMADHGDPAGNGGPVLLGVQVPHLQREVRRAAHQLITNFKNCQILRISLPTYTNVFGHQNVKAFSLLRAFNNWKISQFFLNQKYMTLFELYKFSELWYCLSLKIYWALADKNAAAYATGTK